MSARFSGNLIRSALHPSSRPRLRAILIFKLYQDETPYIVSAESGSYVQDRPGTPNEPSLAPETFERVPAHDRYIRA